MFSRACFILFLTFAMTVSIRAFAAQESKDHGHKSPHGGVVQEAEGIHAELLIDKTGQPKVYLYDKAMKPLERSDMPAKLTVKSHDGAQHERDLKFSKDPKEGPLLKGDPIKGLSDWDTAVVSLKSKDSWTHFRFSHHVGGKAGH
ncbi:MAG TPA: hypothetical protein VGK77_11300 [Candidatus Binatia bacterium]|jgi:hypothetical protein